MKQCQKINLPEPQRNRSATANFVNLIKTSTVYVFTHIAYGSARFIVYATLH